MARLDTSKNPEEQHVYHKLLKPRKIRVADNWYLRLVGGRKNCTEKSGSTVVLQNCGPAGGHVFAEQIKTYCQLFMFRPCTYSNGNTGSLFGWISANATRNGGKSNFWLSGNEDSARSVFDIEKHVFWGIPSWLCTTVWTFFMRLTNCKAKKFKIHQLIHGEKSGTCCW